MSDETISGTGSVEQRERAPVVLFDGSCRFCSAQANRLARMARGRIVLRSFRERGALDGIAGLDPAECEREMKLVEPSGRVYGGAEAVVRALRAGRPVLGRLAAAYYFPGFRSLCDLAYRWIARNRFRLSRHSSR